MNSSTRWIAAPLVIGCIAGLAYVWLSMRQAPATPPVRSEPAHVVQAEPAAPPESTPPPAGEELPTLDHSDPVMRTALGGLLGSRSFSDFFVSLNLIRNIVATVDTLPGKKAPADSRPIKNPQGVFISLSDDQASPLSADNFPRYRPYAELVKSLDVAALAKLYFHYESLFQSAYEERTHTKAPFRSRLLQCIDDLIASPEIGGNIPVARPDAFYQYADPELESRSVGQKLMIRIGTQNAAMIKAQLRALRLKLQQG